MIHLDQLTATLMQVVIENAGAETGALVLLEDDRLTVVAQCSGSRQCNLEKIAVAGCATIPVSVIHSVERTQETLVFDDAVSKLSFSTDPYIQHQQTRSLLCMPILKQNQLIGILYLENNLSTGVFTSDRVQVLKLLIAQAAISLENTRLYERLSDYSETLERKVEEQTQALQQEIAERRQTEAALRQSEANYRNLLQTANSVIIRYDPQGRIHYINDYGVKLLGYEEHQILGRTLFETIIPDIEISGRDVKPFVHDLLRNPQSYPQGEGENLCRDGRRVWVAWSNQAIFNEQGDVVEILSVGNDTTQRRQAEEALQRSEAKFRAIFENSQVGIYRTRTCDGLILNANQRFADLFGFDSPQEIIGIEHTIGYWVNPSDRQQGIEVMKRDGEVRSYEAQMRKRDGTVFWGLFSSYLNAGDDYIEGVIADISDVYDELRLRKQAEVALQASEAELRSLFSAIPDPLCVVTAQGRVIETVAGNPRQLYSSVEEKVGKTLHQIFEEEQADKFMGYIQQVLRTQQVLTVEYSLQIDGRETWFSARIAPIRHEQVIWIARDITLQKRAEAASILEERNRMAREIHDTLAQAFTGILAQVGAAKQVLTDDLEATESHLDLIKELARTGLVEARRSVVALRPQLLEEGSLQSALHRLVAQLRTAAIDTTLYYEIEGAVYSLPTEIESNLLRMGQEALTNAIRHANADEIRVELVYDRDRFCLRVRDNGQGFGVGSIPASEGFGLLGMSERAERIGAQLTIRSQPGQGTEIVVTVNWE
ncbi:PAS domain S-box protein [Nostoc sp. PCC 7120 = FACHB-418]|nr:PAS domain S-box protein [Anabaena cylindrica FACHB-318]MBD2265965.1 PAS domain S-box protein [Anabaena sp. FACHB-709]MBD2275346.1 PAS domain S-box protein [Nostoc sp. PCC 7120 = FACHB-418]MBD2286337.1 PAS domain S-box protein [Anabaena cylindrica FACHB-170]MBD2351891.1 PAS domain S-box protein [Trichormus variabilis FACHB-171]